MWKRQVNSFYIALIWLHCNLLHVAQMSVNWRSRSVNCHTQGHWTVTQLTVMLTCCIQESQLHWLARNSGFYFKLMHHSLQYDSLQMWPAAVKYVWTGPPAKINKLLEVYPTFINVTICATVYFLHVFWHVWLFAIMWTCLSHCSVLQSVTVVL